MGKFADRRKAGEINKKINGNAIAGFFSSRRKGNTVDPANHIGYDPANGVDKSSIATHNGSTLTSFEQYQAAVQIHTQRLKEIKTLEEKAEYKKTVLAEFKPFVDDYIASGHNYPNSVAAEYLIWLLDCELIDEALPLGILLIKQGQPMPKRFKSDMPVFLCDAVYDWATTKLNTQQSASPYLETLLDELTKEEWELYEPVGSKMFAMAAKHADMREDYEQVIHYGTIALSMNEKAGVITIVNKAKKIVANKTATE